MNKRKDLPTLDDVRNAWARYMADLSFENFVPLAEMVKTLMMEKAITMGDVLELRDTPGQNSGRNLMEFVMDLAGKAIVPCDGPGEGRSRIVSELFVLSVSGAPSKVTQAASSEEFRDDVLKVIREMAVETDKTTPTLSLRRLCPMRVADMCTTDVSELSWIATDMTDGETRPSAEAAFYDLLDKVAFAGEAEEGFDPDRGTICLMGATVVKAGKQFMGLPGGRSHPAWMAAVSEIAQKYDVIVHKPDTWTDFKTTACIMYANSRIHELLRAEPGLILPDSSELHLHPSLSETGLLLQVYLRGEKYLGSVEVPGGYLVTNLGRVLTGLSHFFPMHALTEDPLPLNAVI